RAQLGGKSLALRLEGSEGDLVVEAPEAALSVALGNLIGNAVKYTPSGEVLVRLVDGGVQVIDTGPGLSAEDADGLFRRGYRGTHAGHSQGAGIGLSIVSRLCDLYGWKVSVRPREDGEHGVVATLAFGGRGIAAPRAGWSFSHRQPKRRCRPNTVRAGVAVPGRACSTRRPTTRGAGGAGGGAAVDASSTADALVSTGAASTPPRALPSSKRIHPGSQRAASGASAAGKAASSTGGMGSITTAGGSAAGTLASSGTMPSTGREAIRSSRSSTRAAARPETPTQSYRLDRRLPSRVAKTRLSLPASCAGVRGHPPGIGAGDVGSPPGPAPAESVADGGIVTARNSSGPLGTAPSSAQGRSVNTLRPAASVQRLMLCAPTGVAVASARRAMQVSGGPRQDMLASLAATPVHGRRTPGQASRCRTASVGLARLSV